MNVPKTGFDVLDVSLELIRSLGGLLEQVRACDPDLARQLRKAAASVPLNIGEGARRAGKDRAHLYRVAAGSAEETRQCLLIANAWGYVDAAATAGPLELLDRVLAMFWRLTH